MARITFLAVENCLFSGIIGLVDALAIANLWYLALNPKDSAPLFETEIVTEDGNAVNAYGGIPVQPHRSVGEVERTDLILIPPFLPNINPLPEDFDKLMDWFRSQYKRRTRIGAICTGAFALAETGLLDGKIATTNWFYARLFQRLYPEVHLMPERILTEDSGLICSGAATASFNLGLYIIETFGDEELSRVCAKALLVDPSRDSQASYIILDFQKRHRDEDVLKAQSWMETHYSDNIAMDKIAGYVGLSPRHFKRRFKNATGVSPLSYLQQVRIEAAKKKLETTKENMNEITWQIGYEDSSSFRRLFKKCTGLSPREYRDKFSRRRRSVP